MTDSPRLLIALVIGLSVLAGCLGMALWSVGWHLYTDHVLIDTIRTNTEQLQRQQAQGQE